MFDELTRRFFKDIDDYARGLKLLDAYQVYLDSDTEWEELEAFMVKLDDVAIDRDNEVSFSVQPGIGISIMPFSSARA